VIECAYGLFSVQLWKSNLYVRAAADPGAADTGAADAGAADAGAGVTGLNVGTGVIDGVATVPEQPASPTTAAVRSATAR
jgi:hypothetical protein